MYFDIALRLFAIFDDIIRPLIFVNKMKIDVVYHQIIHVAYIHGGGS